MGKEEDNFFRDNWGYLVAKKTVVNKHGYTQWEEGKEYDIGLVAICDQAEQVFVFMRWNCVTDFILWGDGVDEFYDLFDRYDNNGELMED